MALARTGAEVVVYDSARETGGQARLASLAAHRSGWQKLVAYQRDQLADLGVRVLLGTSVTSAELAEYSQLVLATGAAETVVPVPGELRTLTSTDFLDQYADIVPRAPRVAVLDDGFGWWQGISAVERAGGGCSRGRGSHPRHRVRDGPVTGEPHPADEPPHRRAAPHRRDEHRDGHDGR